MKVRSEDAALILVDIQNAWKSEVWSRRNNPEAERVAGRLLEEFRKKGLRVIHVRHESVNPKSLFRRGKDTFEFQDYVMPLSGETIITKHVNSAFIGTELEEARNEHATEIHIVGGFNPDLPMEYYEDVFRTVKENRDSSSESDFDSFKVRFPSVALSSQYSSFEERESITQYIRNNY